MAQVAAKLPLRTSNMNHRFVGARAWMARILVMYCLAELSWLIACALQARSVAKSCIRETLVLEMFGNDASRLHVAGPHG